MSATTTSRQTPSPILLDTPVSTSPLLEYSQTQIDHRIPSVSPSASSPVSRSGSGPYAMVERERGPHLRSVSPTSPSFPSFADGHSLSSLGLGGGAPGARSLSFSARSVGRAIAGRVVRGVKRGNLPFLVVFVSCLGIFFSALAGIGYVEPEPSDAPGTTLSVPAPPGQFVPGAPVYDGGEDNELSRRRKLDEQRELELLWQKKRRPKDGAWMRKQRDDKAVRRVAGPADDMPPFAEDLEGYSSEEKLELAADAGDDAVQGLAKRGMDEVD